ncbi:hypothetical protein OS175_05310 [Marinicella sp. S1101]|uniref:hypothetical protein n=1 Tax=Marinicella marina TaxID=2996016 RepID=UPI002260D6AC|nr:hypothetical protein [Marinicella marina]MCX7553287.1 hypothetical protein [Marinicella marina]MDJ1139019.1 hypothetical protein [Marinicella marina]
MEYHSNTDLFEAIEELQKSLASSGNEEASNLIAEGLSGLNGLTDGWAVLFESLRTINNKYGTSFSKQQSAELNNLQSTVHKAMHRV